MAYIVKQIPTIVNDAVADALGKNSTAAELDMSDIVSMGKALSSNELLEGFFNSLTNRIVKTIYFVRAYKGNTRNILRDEHNFGAFIQKVYFKLPEAVENSTWAIPSDGTYHQTSPYDVESVIGVQSLIYGGQGTWTIEFLRPLQQIRTAFLSVEAMNGFIEGLYLTAENAFNLEEERLVAAAANTGMAASIRAGKSRNLLAEYNAAHSGNELTVATCKESADFHRYVAKELMRTVKNMKNMSTAFNKEGYETFTSDPVTEVLGEFASSAAVYLQSDTFHNELVALPSYEEVAFWQTSGDDFSFDSCSSINITSADLIDENIEGDDGNVSLSGIIAFVHDPEYVAAYFGDRRSWEEINKRDEIGIVGMKAEKGFAVDNHANAVVFYIAEASTLTLSKGDNITSVEVKPNYIDKYRPTKVSVIPAASYEVNTITFDGTALDALADGTYQFRSLDGEAATLAVTAKSK